MVELGTYKIPSVLQMSPLFQEKNPGSSNREKIKELHSKHIK